MRKTIFILLILITLIPGLVWADVSVKLSLERHEVALVDSIKMTVTVSGTRDTDTPEINGLDGFIVQQGGTSSQVQIINGNISSSAVYTYFLQPQREGVFKIGPAKVKVSGNLYQSNIETLTVKNRVEKVKGKISPIFLTASLSSKKAYVEEQLLYTLKLYYLTDVSNVSLDMPEIKDISFKQLKKPVEYQTILNSKNYSVLEVNFSLLPSSIGKYTIHPAKMEMTVRLPASGSSRNRRDPFSFDQFFSFSRGRSITVSSKSIELDVLPLPTQGKPEDFTGLVGSYEMNTSLEPTKIKEGESATLTVIVKGRGNVNRLPNLKEPVISDAKIYADEPQLDINQDEKGLLGVKTMKWAIVPEKEGSFDIPALSLSFFDTGNNAYKKIETSPLILYVEPDLSRETEKNILSDRSPTKVKEHVEELGRDILPIHSSIKSLTSGSRSAISEWLLWFIIFLPALSYAAFLGIFRFAKKTPERTAQNRSAKAANTLAKRCRERDISAIELSDTLRNYFNDRLGLELGSLTSQDARGILSVNGCSDESIKTMETILLQLENKIYTGQGNHACEFGEQIMTLIKRIEKEIR